MGMTNNLTHRLETATKGSREFDAEVALAAGWTTSSGGYFWFSPDTGKPIRNGPLRFTTSIDAAMTLTPKEWRISIESHYFNKKDYPYETGYEVSLWNGKFAPHGVEVSICGATIPLAINAASRKAREADQ